MGPRRYTLAAVRIGSLLTAALLASPSAVAEEARIYYAEPVKGLAADRDTLTRKSGASLLRELRFEAFGRRFELELDENRALLAGQTAKSNNGLRLYRGELRNAPGSWVRLAVKGAAVQGMLWDGAEIYVIEPAAQVRDALNPPLTAGESDTLMFRLSDVVIENGGAACAVADEAPRKASDDYAALLNELKSSPVIMQAAGAQTALQVSALGDAQFLERFGGAENAREAILIRLNTVDGIFSSQLGVAIQTPVVFVNDASSDPLSNETSAPSLLQELGLLRERSAELNSRGLTHLFTGRNLDGDTVGIAYVNTLCHKRSGVGLTEVRTFYAWRDSLIAAHEIGHNFGANHDGDPSGSCPATAPDAYLMAASVSNSEQFSQCSLSVMRPQADAASCITALPDADISIPADLGVTHQRIAQPFEWRLAVTNVGGVSAPRVTANISVPPTISIDDAYVVGGTCTSGAGVITCELGDVPGGATRAVNLTLHGDLAGSNSITAHVAADADAVLTNNHGSGSLSIEPDIDMSVLLSGASAASAGDPFELTFATVNQSEHVARDVQLNVLLPNGVAASAASIDGGACTTESGRVRCSLPSLAGGASATGAMTLTAAAAGSTTITANVSGAYFDPQPGNDSAQRIVSISGGAVTTPTASEAAERSSGGGGALAPAWLCTLLGFALARRRRSRL